MLKLDLYRILEERGVDNPARYLHNNGFTRHTAYNLLNNTKSGINFEHLEKLCLLLQLTPDNLLKWTYNDKTGQYKNHPLHNLKHGPSKGNIGTKIKKLSPDKLEKVRSYLDSLNQSGNENS